MEVVDSVYSTGEKSKQVPVVEEIDHRTGSSFSPFGLGGSDNSQHTASQPPPQLVVNTVNNLEVGRYSALLTIFTAEVDVELGQKLLAELRRSTKKNPPRVLKYEFTYVCHPPYISHQGC